MITDSLMKLYKRDLKALIVEVEAYKEEKNLWLVTGEITNSAGNLCLHVVGNLNAFICESLGNSGYVRKRDLEFSLKDVPKAVLIKQVEDTIIAVENTLLKLSETDLQKEYKRRIFEDTMTTEYFLMHLAMHLSYHLGQINYHRRLLDK
ncbi:DinB family protein [Lacinutrix himadriensis]|uniref:DinB family protein n=1 Tax=Lacinutrix himadriensis TaxID=641549 RepID=UPI0006E2B8C9|nr:DinB family protein [Lacinutrix himadriensis]